MNVSGSLFSIDLYTFRQVILDMLGEEDPPYQNTESVPIFFLTPQWTGKGGSISAIVSTRQIMDC